MERSLVCFTITGEIKSNLWTSHVMLIARNRAIERLDRPSTSLRRNVNERFDEHFENRKLCVKIKILFMLHVLLSGKIDINFVLTNFIFGRVNRFSFDIDFCSATAQLNDRGLFCTMNKAFYSEFSHFPPPPLDNGTSWKHCRSFKINNLI